VSYFKFIKSIYAYIKVKYFYRKHITCLGKIRVVNPPILFFKNKGHVIIGDNVTLNSGSEGYHTTMHSPVKLMADHNNALINIGDNTRIHGSCIHASKSISIGSNCLIAANCHIFDNNGHSLSFDNIQERIHTKGMAKKIVIGNDVWIGINCIILPGVKIGSGSIIRAGSVVDQDIPPMCIAGGNPVRVLKSYNIEVEK